ncbi:MAG: ECF transporter S component, partial [Eubacterium sp.]
MKKTLTVLSILSLIFVVIWQIFFSSTNYYLVSAVILVLSMLPFFISFERSAPTAGELTLLAGLIALAVVSRAVFYLVPQVKPIAAVVGVSGVCLGAKRGYLVGAFSMFISNFIFGQGIWTPFQMVAMGFVGFLFGMIFERVKINRITL